MDVIHPRAAGIDVGSEKLHVAVCDGPVQLFETFTASLHALREYLHAEDVRSVAMEATGVYWLPIYEVLEEAGIEVYVVNGAHVKSLPRITHAAGGHRTGDHEGEIEIVTHRRRHRDGIVGPQPHEQGRHSRRDAGGAQHRTRVHAGGRQHRRLDEDDVGQRDKRRGAADDLGAHVGAARAQLEEALKHRSTEGTRGSALAPAAHRLAAGQAVSCGPPAVSAVVSAPSRCSSGMTAAANKRMLRSASA